MYWNAICLPLIVPTVMLNSNIRCIEIWEMDSVIGARGSWIVTLDVLKSDGEIITQDALRGWIVTLDVLK